MRQDAEPFKSRNAAQVKYPRAVVEIEFEVESIFISTHDDILDIPGVPMLGILQGHAAISQRIIPDEARSEIGSFSFSLIDKDSIFTNAIRNRLLDDGYGLRGKKVRLYIGYASGDDATPISGSAGTSYGGGLFGSGPFGGGEVEVAVEVRPSFSEFKLFQTQIITGVTYSEGLYSVSCNDITREQREDIFDPKYTQLSTALTDSATTIDVYDTSNFHMIAHGSSYSDAPSSTVGYVLIDKEIIRYTGVTPSSFTGCTRGVLNTKAVAHTFESTDEQDRRPKVQEYIYIEEPFAKIAYKVLTGKDPQTLLDCWPPHWNLGIDTDLVRLSDFTGIGKDLWDTSDDASGAVAYFAGLSKVTGKKFLESEIYILLGCYSPIYSDGAIGLRRMNQVISTSASVVNLTEDNCVSWSALKHSYDKLHNRIRIDWNWNGSEFTRNTLFIDQQSIAIHGEAPVKTYQFKGLHGSRHTDALIRTRIESIRDRYSQPPEEMTISVLPSLNVLEVGDVVKANLSTVRDFAEYGDNINRSFEVQQARYDWQTGDISLDLFGSTALASASVITQDTSSASAAFYTDRGTELSTVCTIVVTGGVGVIQAGSYTLTGTSNVNDTGSVFYYDGDLQLGAGATLVINNNVQLRVNGYFQVNGNIDGVGNGKAGVADSGVINTLDQGTPGFIGNSRGMDGIKVSVSRIPRYDTDPAAITIGQYSSFPFIEVAIDGDDILGIPADLRGTSGGSGGMLWQNINSVVVANGGTGAASGAGLVLICKGLGFGASALIDLSGDDSVATSPVNILGNGSSSYPGAGGAGSPGSMLILLDGSGISLPDVSGHFAALCGTVPVNGNTMPARFRVGSASTSTPWAGYLDAELISGADLSDAAYRIQYLPALQVAQEDQDTKPVAPTSLTTTSGINKVLLVATIPQLPSGDRVEFYASSSNDRTTAALVGFGAQSFYQHQVSTGSTRYYWARIRRVQPGVDLFSDWYPSGSTSGVAGSPASVVTGDLGDNAATVVQVENIDSRTITSFPDVSLESDLPIYADTTITRVEATYVGKVTVSSFTSSGTLRVSIGLGGSMIGYLNPIDLSITAAGQVFDVILSGTFGYFGGGPPWSLGMIYSATSGTYTVDLESEMFRVTTIYK